MYYAAFAIRLLDTKPDTPLHFSPGYFQETTGDFTKRVAREVSSRTGWKCEFELKVPTDFSEPMTKINEHYPHPTIWNEKKFWDDFVKFYQEYILI